MYPFYTQAPSFGQVCFDSNVIVSSTSVKSLGVYFDSKLSFERQINEAVKTCSFRLKNLSWIGSKLDPNLKKTLVHSYILSKLDYCNVIYFGANQRLLDKLQSVENTAARFASSTHGFEWRNPGSMYDLLASLHFLPVRYRILYKLCLLCFKCLNNVAPDYLQTLVTICEPSMYNLRRNDDHLLLDVPMKPRYKKMEGAFSYAAPITWNSIPINIRAITNIDHFKTALKTYFFQRAFR